ncbi:hypothetical protein [uncultured Roseobacter sp.]|uniref:hypothetical protein n=1 Tax=uncultured Roseobacter sp. TaxID=114847 RepID=UPI002608CD88|nr:hypothetical protein [uncultured Roseobacter sp.]
MKFFKNSVIVKHYLISWNGGFMHFLTTMTLAAVITGTAIFTSFALHGSDQTGLQLVACDPQVRRCD